MTSEVIRFYLISIEYQSRQGGSLSGGTELNHKERKSIQINGISFYLVFSERVILFLPRLPIKLIHLHASSVNTVSPTTGSL